MTDVDLAFLDDFLVEAREHLEEMEQLLLDAASQQAGAGIYDDIFRVAHSIKGGAQYLGLDHLATLTHRMEDVLDRLRGSVLTPTLEIFDLLVECRDRLVALLNEVEADHKETSEVDDLAEKLSLAMRADAGDTPPVPDSAPDVPEYNEVHDADLFSIFFSNLLEHYNGIKLLAAGLPTSVDHSKTISEISDHIEAARSSANYMGYIELRDLLTDWLQFMGTPDIGEQEIKVYLEQLRLHFPQLEDGSYEKVSPVVKEEVQSSIPDMPQKDGTDMVEEVEGAISLDIDLDLLPDFLVESEEHLEEIENFLLRLKPGESDQEVLGGIFRSIHTIKGGSQFVGLKRIAVLSHRMEDLLDMVRSGHREVTEDIIDLLISGRDRLAALMQELEANQAESSPVGDLVGHLSAIIEAKDSKETDSEKPAVSTSDQVSLGDKEAAVADEVVEPPGIDAGMAVTPASSLTPAPFETAPLDFSLPDEDYDHELYGIFNEHLREQFEQLIKLYTSDASPEDKLRGSIDVVESLRTSSNYMGYDSLSDYYQRWVNAMQQALSSLIAGQSIVEIDFIHGYALELTNVFSELADLLPFPASQPEEKSAAVQQDLTAEVSPPSAQLDDDLSVDEDLLDDELLTRLSDALDGSMSDTGEPYETLQLVFDEVLSGGMDEQSDKPSQAISAAVPVQPSVPVASEEDVDAVEKINQAVTQVQKQEARKQQATPVDKSDAAASAGSRAFKKSIRVDAEKIDTLMNQVGELVVDRSYFHQLFQDMRGLQSYLKESAGLDSRDMKQIRGFLFKMSEAIASLGRTSNELQEGVMKVRMLPIAQLFNRYPRLVHDLTRKNGKIVDLQVSGEDTELDKMVVEELSDPLIHIIRNSVDHGLESPEDRVKAGKPETGVLKLDAYQESNQIVIEVTDDGRGIDHTKVRDKAFEKGLYSEEELDRMSNKELLWLIMAPGFSTAVQITDTSGRGVGMDVVKKNIEKLNGTLEIESELGEGTKIRLKIPLTLAIIAALQVRVGEGLFTIPLANVEETLKISQSEVTSIEGAEVIQLRGKTLPIFHLSRLFNLESQATVDERFVVVVRGGMQQLGLVVDELLRQDEVVIKPLVDYLQERSGFSGATIIGDGRISLILDVHGLAQMTVERQVERHRRFNRSLTGPQSNSGVQTA